MLQDQQRFSPHVAALRARLAISSLGGILDEARASLESAESEGGSDLPALLIVIGSALSTSGEFAEAVRHHTRAHDAAVAIGDRELEAEAALGIGAALMGAEDHISALQHFERAEKIAAECGNDSLRASILRRIGATCSILGRHQQALDVLGEAASVLASIEPSDAVTLERLHLANSTLNAKSRRIEQIPREDPQYVAENEALLPLWLVLGEDARRAGMERLEIMALGNYAIDAGRAGKQLESIRVLRELVPRYEALAMRPNVAIAWNHLGYAHEAVGDFSAARHAFEQARALLEGGNIRERREAHEGISRAAENLNDPWGALEALKAARAIDSTKDDEQARLLAARREHRIEMARLTERWERLAEQDPLTGLNNRRALEAWLDGRARDSRQPFALLLVDLDGFKAINDRYGHAIGDRVLAEVGKLLREGCRQQDVPARFGGDEFVVALPGADEAEALRVAERLRSAIAGHGWDALTPGLAVTASVGGATSIAGVEGPGATEVFAIADRRLYHAKRTGRNRVCVSDE